MTHVEPSASTSIADTRTAKVTGVSWLLQNRWPEAGRAVAALQATRRVLFGDRVSYDRAFGRYEVQRELGRGGGGLVLAARDPELDRTVAIKLLRWGAAGDGAIRRMRREAELLARFDHPNVVRVFDAGEYDLGVSTNAGDEGRGVYVVMELIQGQTLMEWARSRERSPGEVVELAEQIGRGLQAMHDAGLVHRDVKPSNVLVDGHGRARLIDFGIAKAMFDTWDNVAPPPVSEEFREDRDIDTTEHGVVVGTNAFMAPEQYQGADADARTDEFALAVTVWQLLTGRLPFGMRDYRRCYRAKIDGRLPRLPRQLRRFGPVLRRALDPVPSQRFSNIRAFTDALAVAQKRRGPRLPYLLAGMAAGLSLMAFTSADPQSTESIDPVSMRVASSWGALQSRVPRPREGTGLRATCDRARRLAEQAKAGGKDPLPAPAAFERGRCLALLGRLDEAAAQYEAAYFSAGQTGPAAIEARAASRRALLAVGTQADPRLADRWCRHATSALPSSDPNVPASVHADCAMVAFLSDDLSRAHERIELALADLSDVEDPIAIGSVRDVAGRIAMAADDWTAAQEHLAVAVEALEGHGSPTPDLSSALAASAYLANKQGRHEDALALYERADEIARQTALPSHPKRVHLVVNWSAVYFAMGRYEDTMRLCQGTLRSSAGRYGPRERARLQECMGTVRAAQGRFSDAVDHYTRARDAYARSSSAIDVARASGNLGRALAEAGDPQRAVHEFRVGIEAVERRFGSEHRLLAALHRDLGLLLTGFVEPPDKEGARAHFKIALRIVERARPDDPEVQRLRSLLAQ